MYVTRCEINELTKIITLEWHGEMEGLGLSWWRWRVQVVILAPYNLLYTRLGRLGKIS